MKSQQRVEVASEQAKKDAKKAAGEKKIATAMKARKKNVSQLLDDLSEIGSSP